MLTGAAGRLGTTLRNFLSDKDHFRCLGIQPVDHEKDTVTADIKDFESLISAMAGIEAVVHQTSNPDIDQPWERVYANEAAGTYNVFDAARRAGVKKVIYAFLPRTWDGRK